MGITKRKLISGGRPLLTKQDAWFLAELPALVVVASFVPERYWARFCYHLEQVKAQARSFDPAAILRGMKLIGGESVGMSDALRVAATRSEHHLQIIRELFWGWSAPLKLQGAEQLDLALAAGQGAVLWIAHFSFNALANKKALHQAGYDVTHLSRPEHGFSKSRFGIAVLNPMRINAENRYLKDRIIIDRTRPASAVQRARKRLTANKIISITAGAWEGSQVARVAIRGRGLDLAAGAPGLSYLTGAPLLPVVTVRDEGSSEVRVIVQEPIPIDRSVGRESAVYEASQRFADRLVPFVDSHRYQWRDWEKIRRVG